MIALRTVHFPEFYWRQEGADDDFYDRLVFLLLDRILRNCVILADSEAVLVEQLINALDSWPPEHAQRAGQIKRKLIDDNAFRQTFIKGTVSGDGGRGCDEALTLVDQLSDEIDGVAVPSQCSSASCGCQTLTVSPSKAIRVDLLQHQDKFEQKRSRRESYRVKPGIAAKKFHENHFGSLINQARTIEIHDRYIGRNLYDTLKDPKKAQDIQKFANEMRVYSSLAGTPPKYRKWSDISNAERTIQWLLGAATNNRPTGSGRVAIRIVTELGKVRIDGDALATPVMDLMVVRDMLAAYQDYLQLEWGPKGADVTVDVKLSSNGYDEMDHWRYFVVDHLGWYLDRGADWFVGGSPIRTREARYFAIDDVDGATAHNNALFDAGPENIFCLATSGMKALKAQVRQSRA